MPEKTSYAPGTPCWVDVSADDVAASAAFYCSLFGWDATEMPDAGGYTMLFQDGKSVAAVGVNQGGGPAVWSTYIATADADETAAKITAAGGTLVVDVTDVMDAGRMAFATDPHGAMFGVWEPASHTGAQLVNEPCSYTWGELSTTDAEAAQAFYTAVFGWEPQAMPGDHFYAIQNIAGNPVAGLSEADETRAGWGLYFAVADLDATTAKAEELGGAVLGSPSDTPYGRMAPLADAAGAAFSVIEMSGEASDA